MDTKGDTTKRNHTVQQRYVLAVAFLLMLFWGVSAMFKFADLKQFNAVLQILPGIPRRVAGILSYAIPISFVLTFLLLCEPRVRPWGFVASLGILLVFTVYIGYMLATMPMLSLPCTCGGLHTDISWVWQLALNSSMTLLAGIAIWLDIKRHSGIPP